MPGVVPLRGALPRTLTGKLQRFRLSEKSPLVPPRCRGGREGIDGGRIGDVLRRAADLLVEGGAERVEGHGHAPKLAGCDLTICLATPLLSPMPKSDAPSCRREGIAEGDVPKLSTEALRMIAPGNADAHEFQSTDAPIQHQQR